MERVAITGSSGYLGSLLANYFLNRDSKVLGIDLNPSGNDSPNFEEQLTDITSDSLFDLLQEFQPDTVIHCAFVFQPMRDQNRMREINIGGFNNLVKAVCKIAAKRFHVASSATAYGAHSDNPELLSENDVLRESNFQYANDKREIEVRLSQLDDELPDTSVSWSRPCLIGGPGMDNYLSRFLFGMPFMVLPDGNDTPLQFVHEEDVVAAISKIVSSDSLGPFNIGPGDASALSLIAKKSGRRAFKLPYWMCYWTHWLAWQTRFPLHESPPSLLEFARNRWVVDSSRISEELGFQFQYSSDETLDIMIENLGR